MNGVRLFFYLGDDSPLARSRCAKEAKSVTHACQRFRGRSNLRQRYQLEKQLGIRYLSFEIRNLSGVCSVLQDKGVEFVMPETQVFPGRYIAMVQDPDGNIIEFVERR